MLEDEFIPASSLKIGEKNCKGRTKPLKQQFSIEEIWKKIKYGNFKLDQIKHINWMDFEKFCSYVLRKHGFQCINNVRFRCKNKKRHEIDIIARSEMLNIIFSIDAKHWKIGGRAKIASAAENQMIRTKNLLKKCEKVFNHKINFKNFKNYRVIPLIITVRSETIFLFKGVPIIPLDKLNNFLQNFDGYLESFCFF